MLGIYLHDTRHLSEYRWDFGPLACLTQNVGADHFFQHRGMFEDRAQRVSVARTFTLLPDGFEDALVVTNEDMADREISLSLTFDVDFRDVFEARGRERQSIGYNAVQRDGPHFRYQAQDGVICETRLAFQGFPPGDRLAIKAGETRHLIVRGAFSSSLHGAEDGAPSVNWTEPARAALAAAAPVALQAFADIEMLMASSPQGPIVLTGVPNFVNVFGRDSLITSWFLLQAAPEVAKTTLRLLAARQGTESNAMTREAPGKIAHELRDSELARTGDVPFGRYYGTADASALYVILMRDYVSSTGDKALASELADAWRGAIGWCRQERGDDGLLRYSTEPLGRGLINNSWKDSADSMSFSDGTLATGRLAVVEVQGYLAAALKAAADLEEAVGGGREAATLRQEASELRDLIDSAFWNDGMGLHAIAVDDAGRQCDVVSSNPGHLLWAGVLSESRARAVAERLMEADMWTGWGVRCLSRDARRYKPLSYHNGSVWPHDNGMIAAGATRYGLTNIAEKVWRGMEESAAALPGLRLPELFGGYDRQIGRPPIVYAQTCAPQAWAAAALVHREMGSPP